MDIKNIIEEKKEWKAKMQRVKALPIDYQVVYKEIQKYVYKISDIDLKDSMMLLDEIINIFEDGSLEGMKVLQITGNDVASFCDELIKALTIK